ncbi:MAG: hypothetical protein JWN48_3629 [Myxococcaceae bacterium]|nr:hypothetical protein [Myxococcaceae bacterium]
MTQDHNKKSLRQFQCRDYLWEIFEQMGAELECSTDYLVNEAMRQYARSRNWGARSNAAVGAPALAASAPARPEAMAPPVPSAPRNTGGLGAAPPLPGANRAPQHTPPAGAPRARSVTGPQAMRPPGGTVPPPLPGGGFAPPGRANEMPPLSVIFNGQKVPVNKEEFVIGRGSKTADLPIKDGNISRRHAAIVLQNGNFYMKDLGSTNGIEFNGERVESRLIQEGDVYQLCDYELRFTYQ